MDLMKFGDIKKQEREELRLKKEQDELMEYE